MTVEGMYAVVKIKATVAEWRLIAPHLSPSMNSERIHAVIRGANNDASVRTIPVHVNIGDQLGLLPWLERIVQGVNP